MQVEKALRHIGYMKSRPTLLYRTAEGFVRTMALGQNRLRSVEFAVTYRCNATCGFCYSLDLYNKQRQELTVDQFKKIWDQCYKLGAIHVNLTGGEPMLRSDLADVIRVMKPHGTMVSCVTNASLSTKSKLSELKDAGLGYLQISLDSANEKQHDVWRGIPGLHEKAVNTARMCKQLGIPCCFSSVVFHNGIDTFEKIMKIAEELNVDILMNYVETVGGWKAQGNVSLLRDDLERITKLRTHPKVRHHSMYNFNGTKLCPVGREKIYLSAYGDVMSGVKVQNSFGNALETPLKQIWQRMWNETDICESCRNWEEVNEMLRNTPRIEINNPKEEEWVSLKA